MFSSITTESFYVIDIAKSRFCYVQSDDFFLCGHSVEDALNLGYDFYKKVVVLDDLPLWEKMLTIIISYFNGYGEKQDKVDYFSCTFRLQRKYSFLIHSLPQMVYHRMKPVFVNNELCFLICSLKSSTAKETGNLCLHSKDGLTCKEYNLITHRWKEKTKEPLTERERAILMIAQHGKSTKEIANDLCKGHHTIRNQIKPIFSKLNIHSMQEAIEFAFYHRMIYSKQDIQLQPFEPHAPETRVILTNEKKAYTKNLDNGKSI